MLEGRVTVNGVVIRELGTKADAARDDIRVDGRRVKVVQHHRYLLLNKPRGYVSTRSDPEGRPTVIDLLGGRFEYVYPVGRLDFDSEGLLLLTNDGDLAARLTHPRHGVPRVYEARVLGVPDRRDLDRLSTGIVIDGRRTAASEITLHEGGRGAARAHRARPEPDARGAAGRGRRLPPRAGAVTRASRNERDVHATLTITIREGRNRQIRKMCDAIGHPITQLKRVAIGPIRDPALKPGRWRELTVQEVERLRKAAQ